MYDDRDESEPEPPEDRPWPTGMRGDVTDQTPPDDKDERDDYYRWDDEPRDD
jgi:hypothetical protein